MNLKTVVIALVAMTLAVSAHAQADFEGTWELSYPGQDGNTYTMVMEIKEDTHTIDMDGDGTAEVEAGHEIEGDVVTVWSTGGEMACPPEMKGKYRYTVTETTLTIEKIEDPCENRGSEEPMTFTRKKA